MLQRLMYSVSMGFISDCILIYIFRLFAGILCVDLFKQTHMLYHRQRIFTDMELSCRYEQKFNCAIGITYLGIHIFRSMITTSTGESI